MFRKPPKTKPSAAIRSSDCRKFRADICQRFGIGSPEDGQLLVPEGLHNARFYTNTNDQGTVYIDPSTGDPLWFTLGKDPAPIPTVYTLWKRHLLPCLSTPTPALERIQGGADLMMPGVISVTYSLPGNIPSLPANALVAVARHGSTVPMAIGRLLLPLGEVITALRSDAEVKGKAVQILSVYRDCLWETGSKAEPPENLPEIQAEIVPPTENDVGTSAQGKGEGTSQPNEHVASVLEDLTIEAAPEASTSAPTTEHELSSEEIDTNIRLALLQSISQVLAKQPDTLPILASTFLTAYLQPSRPQRTPPLDLKRSSHKNLTKLLKTAEKDGWLKVKEIKGVLTLMSVDPSNPEVKAHRPFKTVGDVEAQERAKAERKKVAESAVTALTVKELYKPAGTAVVLFEESGKDSSGFYTAAEVRQVVNDYISSHSLVHPQEPTYIVADDLLKNALRSKDGAAVEFVRRDEIVPQVLERMQKWHSIGDGKPKKGDLKPISVAVKIRNGRKAVTIITGFEEYSIPAEFLEEELKVRCASSTTSGPIAGQAKGGKAMEVMVQGKHLAPVRELLIAQGVPKSLILETDPTTKKKK